MTQQPQPISDPAKQAREAYAQSEKAASKTLENLVSSQSFAESLALFTSNAVALSRMAQIGLDQVVRMTRLAGRTDITRLGTQLARTEDKLEHVLQVVELLESELQETRSERDQAREAAGHPTPAQGGRGRSERAQATQTPSGNGKPNGRTRVPRTASPAIEAAESVVAAKDSAEDSR
ncbi:MAG: hypothetical protein Q4P32_13235 [Micrococcales bacterium]|nr:hypothetical protein [Micrococcales bacterium]